MEIPVKSGLERERPIWCGGLDRYQKKENVVRTHSFAGSVLREACWLSLVLMRHREEAPSAVDPSALFTNANGL